MDEEPSTSSGIKSQIPPDLLNEIDVIAARHPRKAGIVESFNSN